MIYNEYVGNYQFSYIIHIFSLIVNHQNFINLKYHYDVIY